MFERFIKELQSEWEDFQTKYALRTAGESKLTVLQREGYKYERDALMVAAIKAAAYASGVMPDREAAESALQKLATWKPECGFPMAKGLYGREAKDASDGYCLDDCEFLTEAYLYELLGKEDARTLMALISDLAAAAGISRDEQWKLERQYRREEEKNND